MSCLGRRLHCYLAWAVKHGTVILLNPQPLGTFISRRASATHHSSPALDMLLFFSFGGTCMKRPIKMEITESLRREEDFVYYLDGMISDIK